MRNKGVATVADVGLSFGRQRRCPSTPSVGPPAALPLRPPHPTSPHHTCPHDSTLSDRSLEVFFGSRSRKKMAALDVSGCELVTNRGLKYITKSCRYLTR